MDLATLTDTQLDASLQHLFRQHTQADPSDRLPIHMAIVDVLAEQGRRLDGWLDHALGLTG